MKAVWMSGEGEKRLFQVYAEPVRRELEGFLSFLREPVTDRAQLSDRQAELSGVSFIFTTWGMLPLTEDEIARFFPSLQAVFYGAGTVQYFARPFLSRGIRVFSSAQANAVPVAEYAVSQIILAGKGFYQASRLYKERRHAEAAAYAAGHCGNYGTTVGILGAGRIGQLVIQMLKAHTFKIKVFDPFLPDERAQALGVQKCGLEELFADCSVISNHLANNEQTKGMLNYHLFARMADNATFINTGRGAQVVEEDLARALAEKPDRTAVLDVTMPEPVQEDSPFFTLKNVILTPHIAGSMRDEVARLGEYQKDAYFAVRDGKPCELEVTLPMLETMA